MPFVRRPLAFLICCGLTGACLAPFAGQAWAQGMAPLSVDPALLGLPPATPRAPATESQPSPQEAAAPARTAPVRSPEPLQSRPLTPAPAKTPAPPPKPSSAPAPTAIEPARPTPATVPPVPGAPISAAQTPPVTPARPSSPPSTSGRQPRLPLTAPPEVVAREPAAGTPASAPVRSQAPAMQHKGSAPATALGAFRVDPTLLGLPPLASTPAPSPRAEAPPIQPSRISDPQPRAELQTGPQDLEPALALRRSRTLAPVPKNDDPHPSFLTARRIYGVADREAVLEGDAELRRGDTLLTSDHLVYWQNDDEVEATGNVVYRQEGTVVSGPRLKMKLAEQTGVFDQASYAIRQEKMAPVWGVVGNYNAMASKVTDSHGQSERLEFLGENHLKLANATYTTCKPGNNGWYARAESLDLDYEREEGQGQAATLYFKDVPVFYMPKLSFSLNNRRKSGFLAPTFGTNSISGAMLTTPYYWNIAPNMDATIAPRLMTKRGLQIGGELRYLDYSYNGYLRGEYLPTDNVRNMDNRYSVNFWHQQDLGNGFSGLLNLNKVSDYNFFTDLSSRLGVSAQTLVPRQGVLRYGSTWWNAAASISRYQTLQPDASNPITPPYDIAPQLTLNARRPDYFGTDLAFLGQYSAFSHPTQVQGSRIVAYPQVSVPMMFPAFYVTPKVGMHVTQYNLDQQVAGKPTSISRGLPILSLDAGLTLERETSLLGRNFTQTLEPRLYYVYVPYKDQSQNPVFDTGIADFNFGQIFSENRYVGQDRIGDANQLTAALTSRFVNPESGREYFRAMVGQRYYFDDQKVTLPGEQIRQRKNTNWLGAFSGQVYARTFLDGAVEYNPEDGRTDRLAINGRYQPELRKVLNAGYRYIRDTLGNVDVSGQWPLGGGWYGVGRYNYSLKEKRVVENIAGLEYSGDCWVVRGVVQQYALTASTSSTAFFVQLELSDFSSIGSNPLDMLRRTIPGYGRLNQPMANPVFGGEE